MNELLNYLKKNIFISEEIESKLKEIITEKKLLKGEVILSTNSLKKEKGHDLILSIAHPYPIHWGVASIWNKNQSIAKYWIADCGDPYLNQDNGGWKPPYYFGFVEKWFMRKATFITVPIVEALSGYFKEFHDKIKIIFSISFVHVWTFAKIICTIFYHSGFFCQLNHILFQFGNFRIS